MLLGTSYNILCSVRSTSYTRVGFSPLARSPQFHRTAVFFFYLLHFTACVPRKVILPAVRCGTNSLSVAPLVSPVMGNIFCPSLSSYDYSPSARIIKQGTASRVLFWALNRSSGASPFIYGPSLPLSPLFLPLHYSASFQTWKDSLYYFHCYYYHTTPG